jgi:hypothetical protein
VKIFKDPKEESRSYLANDTDEKIGKDEAGDKDEKCGERLTTVESLLSQVALIICPPFSLRKVLNVLLLSGHEDDKEKRYPRTVINTNSVRNPVPMSRNMARDCGLSTSMPKR